VGNTPNDPEDTRVNAAYYLGELGEYAKPVVGSLVKATDDPAARVRSAAAFALGKTGDTSVEVTKALEKLLTDVNADTRFSAAFALWKLQPAKSETFHRVNAMITSSNLSWPAICVQRAGPGARAFAPRLVEVIDGLPWSYQRIQAVHAVWSTTGDRVMVKEQLDSLEHSSNCSVAAPPLIRSLAGRRPKRSSDTSPSI
jgi:hypothetical protein